MSAEAILARLPQTGIRLGLDRIEKACDALGRPQGRFPSILIAGTNGKGSTAAFLAAALQAGGRRVGLYTSPHLVSFRERIRVDGAPVAEAALDAAMAQIAAACPSALRPDHPDALSYFEVATVLAFLVFAEARVDLAVLEAGLGGRLDATNLEGKALVATALTPIALDHQEWLGEALAAVAAEKVAVARPGVPLVVAPQAGEVREVVRRQAEWLGAPLVEVEASDESTFHATLRPISLPQRREEPAGPAAGSQNAAAPKHSVPSPLRGEGPSTHASPLTYHGLHWHLEHLRPGLLGAHQLANAATALAILESLPPRLAVTREAARAGIAAATWPGRLQILREHPLVVLDGAHNPQAAAALAAGFPALWPGLRPQLVFGVLEDKDRAPMMRTLFPLAAHLHLCAPPLPRAAPAEKLLAESRSFLSSAQSAEAHASVNAAIDAALDRAGKDGAVLICGSLYLVGAALEKFSCQVS